MLLSTQLVALPATVAMVDHGPVAEVARPMIIPSAFEELFTQDNVSEASLAAQANHAQTTTHIATRNLRAGLCPLRLLGPRTSSLKRVQFKKSLHLLAPGHQCCLFLQGNGAKRAPNAKPSGDFQ